MMALRIDPSEVVCGQPLGFDIVSYDGRLLLSKGQVINFEEKRIQIIESGFKLPPEEKDALQPVCTRMEKVAVRLAAIEEDLVQGRALGNWHVRVRNLTQDLIDVAARDPDAAFAVMHLEVRHSYDVVHHAMAALVCARLAKRLDLDRKDQVSLVAAAITHDIAVLSMRREIEAVESLSADQRQRIRAHCESGVRMLRELGVTDELWLQAVQEHHEYLDGSGYAGLAADEIGMPSRVMAVADALSAMLRPRPYRDRVYATAAMTDLCKDSQGRYDQTLVAMLVEELGVFPPGSVVRLANRETAVVIRTLPGQMEYPRVVAIMDGAGRPLFRARSRDTTLEEMAIVGLVAPEMVGKVRQQLFTYWSEKDI